MVSILLDTEADISLISHDRLSARRAAAIQPSQRCNPMAVTGHEIQVIGTLRMTVQDGGLVINIHPFLVVRNLIVPFIGGVDFLSRLGTQTWDWENRTLLVCGRKLRPKSMYRNSSSIDSPRKPIQSCQVIGTNDVRVQPDEETLVPCSLKRAVPNTKYLLEPQCQQDEYPMRGMCCLIRPADESATIQFVNCGTQEEVVCTGQMVGMAFPEFEAVLQSVVGKGDHRSVSGYEIDTRRDRNKQEEITDLINKYGDIYWQEGDQLPTIKAPVEHAMHLKPNATPQWARPRRLAPDIQKKVRKEIDYQLKQGLIRELSSPWAAPIVTARRKNGNLRLAMDYRRFNGLAQHQHQPFPLIDDLVDRCKVLFNSRPQVRLLPDANAGRGLVKDVICNSRWSIRMDGPGTPFGLLGAPETF